MITQLWNPEEAEDLGIPCSSASLFYRWQSEGRSVFFSIAQMGDSLICHVAADRKGKRALRTAINQMAQYFFMTFPEAKQIISHSYMNSMKNMTKKCGFELLLSVESEKAEGGEFEILRLVRAQ